jgi:biotin carboxyl carrier protein
MRKFVVTVNGTSYEVEVEEQGEGITTSAAGVEPVKSESAATQPAPKSKPAAKSTPAGSKTIAAPMPGTILDINVKVGDSITKGQVLCILEAMKMENEIMAPQDGKVVSVNVSKGASVNAGDVLFALQ